MTQPLIKVSHFSLGFQQNHRIMPAVKDVSFEIFSGETVAVVGESGSGKSVTALALTRLLPCPPAIYQGGEIEFEGKSVLKMSSESLKKMRGKGVAYIFQEPGSSLNPVFSIGFQIAEAIRLHRPEIKDVKAEIVRLLELVGIQNPKQRINDYPHQLSGGMQQRVMIAMALACEPKLLVADEPTTALDVTIQKQIMDLLRELKEKLGMTILLITHNFGLVSGFANKVFVMFRGKIVESGPTSEILKHPRHPYTQALLACVPVLGRKQDRLRTINYAEIEKAQEVMYHD
ncbi:MAG: ABC transporter ATP-binding protein [Verrucomicrobiae bacterium]|nr:ABC transporter ATP-binding protein [Verrucomicrobiae bacterium]